MASRNLKGDQGAMSGVLAFGVAGTIFLASVLSLMYATKEASGPAAADPPKAAQLTTDARSLAALMLDSTGYNGTDEDWAPMNDFGQASANADGLKRLGLLDAGDKSALSFAKLQNLRRAPYEPDPDDGYVNYPEAAETMGLTETGLDFHIRAYPTLKSVRDILRTGYKDPNLRVTYIGDIDVSKSGGQPPPVDPTEGLTVTAPACAISPLTSSPDPQNYRLSAQVTNGGTTTTQFSALFTYRLGPTEPASQNSNSFLVAPGQTVTVHVDVPASTETQGVLVLTRSCDVGSTIEVDVNDPTTIHVQAESIVTTAVTGAVTAPRALWLDTTKPYFVNPSGATSGCSDPVKINYDGKTLQDGDKLALQLHTASGGTQVFPSSGYHTFTVPKKAQDRWVQIGCVAAGDYVATLRYYTGASPSASNMRVTENVLVTTAVVSPYSAPSAPASEGSEVYTPTAAATAEVTFLDTLVHRFCPTYFGSATEGPVATDWPDRCSDFKDGHAQPGDVFPDSKHIMNNDLPARLLNADGTPRYDLVNVLVAGSNVDQTAMTSQAAKGAVATWVMGGGTLLVFGSAEQNVNWLEPIFHAAIRSSSGGIGVPDPGHPVLHVSDELDYPAYENRDRVWNFNGQTALHADELFTNVVVEGADPVTTVSNAGAMGDGSVILTTWTPHDVYDGAADPDAVEMEGLRLTNNLLMLGYRDLFLDYGPPIPDSTNVIPAERIVQVRHPQFEEPVQLSVILFVF